jgi:hypothetical protein
MRSGKPSVRAVKVVGNTTVTRKLLLITARLKMKEGVHVKQVGIKAGYREGRRYESHSMVPLNATEKIEAW